jgi:hypothetical protein
LVVQVLGSVVNFLDYGASLVSLDPHAEWTLAIYDVRYQPIWGHLQFLRPEHLDLAWVRPVAGDQFVVDWCLLAPYLGTVLACAVGLWLWERRGGRRTRGLVWLLAALCSVVIIFGQVRLHDALVTQPGVRPWEQLYEQIAASARAGDVLFVQNGVGAETGYWLDGSRMRRYDWSPRPVPLDPGSGEWIRQYLDGLSDTVERVWLASDRPAMADQERGIERWLLDWGAKLFDREFDGGSRLVLFERIPRSLVQKTADATFGDQVRLLRYAIPDEPVASGEAVHVVLTWEAVAQPQFDYSVFVHLVDENGRICRQADGSPVGGFRPMSTWQEGELITDRYALLLPPAEECTPGDYRLLAGVYRWDTLERLPIVAGSTPPTAAETRDALDLGEVRIQGTQAVHS